MASGEASHASFYILSGKFAPHWEAATKPRCGRRAASAREHRRSLAEPDAAVLTSRLPSSPVATLLFPPHSQAGPRSDVAPELPAYAAVEPDACAGHDRTGAQ